MNSFPFVLHCLAEPAQHEKQFVDDNIGRCNRWAAGIRIRIHQPFDSVWDSKQLCLSSRHDSQIISGVTDLCIFPIDGAQTILLPILQDVLWQ
jgi:hypothetical protein